VLAWRSWWRGKCSASSTSDSLGFLSAAPKGGSCGGMNPLKAEGRRSSHPGLLTEARPPGLDTRTSRFEGLCHLGRLRRRLRRLERHLDGQAKNARVDWTTPVAKASKIPPAPLASWVIPLFAGTSCGRYLPSLSPVQAALSPAAPDSDRGSNAEESAVLRVFLTFQRWCGRYGRYSDQLY
jgi:hypothetical protein